MLLKKHTPAYPLSDYIQHIIYAHGSEPLPYLMELPEGKVNLVIELMNTSNTVYTEKKLSGKRTMKNAWLTGTQAQTIIYENNNNSAILSIKFTTGGFYALTKIPATEIIYPGLEAEFIFGNTFKQLYQKLINEKNISNLFQLVEEYFLSRVKNDHSETLLAGFIDKNITKPIDWLVEKSGYSQKHLIHTIKKQTGFSPKYLQRLHRFQNVIRSIQFCKGKINWASIAYYNNYFDQAHFIKEFVHFMDLTPVEYFVLTSASEHNKTFSDVKLLTDMGR
jgi:AraC-like DNA-binding protein